MMAGDRPVDTRGGCGRVQVGCRIGLPIDKPGQSVYTGHYLRWLERRVSVRDPNSNHPAESCRSTNDHKILKIIL